MKQGGSRGSFRDQHPFRDRTSVFFLTAYIKSRGSRGLRPPFFARMRIDNCFGSFRNRKIPGRGGTNCAPDVRNSLPSATPSDALPSRINNFDGLTAFTAFLPLSARITQISENPSRVPWTSGKLHPGCRKSSRKIPLPTKSSSFNGLSPGSGIDFFLLRFRSHLSPSSPVT